ncbi:uncharacterized protein LOC109704402 [Ananas comosus]|uniref:Uncharacterized protein LOC109704402 n=1 Tax=Ananas comosus TaxID=4615 RepID=A0A6P5EGZ4_ANACO|nr:uncharacterized protein LOC109704402 [Ananas comosus]
MRASIVLTLMLGLLINQCSSHGFGECYDWCCHICDHWHHHWHKICHVQCFFYCKLHSHHYSHPDHPPKEVGDECSLMSAKSACGHLNSEVEGEKMRGCMDNFMSSCAKMKKSP